MHHYECVAPNVDINLQSGWFCATSVASFREMFIDFRSCWVVFIHVVRGRPGGLLQFSNGISSVPRHNLAFGSRAFRTSAPKIWISLPPHILQSQTLSSFRHHLKSPTTFSQPILPPSAHPQCALILFSDFIISDLGATYKSLTYLLT